MTIKAFPLIHNYDLIIIDKYNSQIRLLYLTLINAVFNNVLI